MEIDGSSALRSGELARKIGVSKDTLRHYERIGVLAPPQRTDSGYRLYSPDSVTRLEKIRRAMTIGFTLEEIAEILRVRDSDQAPCRDVQRLAKRKLAELEERIEELTRARNNLANVLREWDLQLASTPKKGFAFLLDRLASEPHMEPRQPGGKP